MAGGSIDEPEKRPVERGKRKKNIYIFFFLFSRAAPKLKNISFSEAHNADE